ncbi:hypothetical protein NYE67_11060 [Solibacillus sp. FSL W8-0474]|uniref:hypothetical protein n=1 Tax=Solibacillus sp. FSL W8-0474 TaxID=2975336 RepID=UPI0030FB4477
MKKTGIQVNTGKKVVNISVNGKMTMEDANAFVADYNAKMKAITPSTFDLEVDCTQMQLLNPDMTANLTEVMKMYKTTGFKQVKFTVDNNITLKMQLNRLANSAGLTNATVELIK